MKRVLILLLAIAGMSAPAFAQNYKPDELAASQANFAMTDANKDGVITRDEVDKRMVALVSAGTFPDEAAAKQQAGRWMTMNDKNGNGTVEEPETRDRFIAKLRAR